MERVNHAAQQANTGDSGARFQVQGNRPTGLLNKAGELSLKADGRHAWFTQQQAAHELGVDVKTFKRRADVLGIVASPNPLDRRELRVRREDVDRIRAAYSESDTALEKDAGMKKWVVAVKTLLRWKGQASATLDTHEAVLQGHEAELQAIRQQIAVLAHADQH